MGVGTQWDQHHVILSLMTPKRDSANSQMAHNWENWLADWMVVLPFRATLDRL